MRKKIVAGNWKMNKTYEEGIDLLNEIKEFLRNKSAKHIQVIIAPPYIHLNKFAEILKSSENVNSGSKLLFLRKWRIYR